MKIAVVVGHSKTSPGAMNATHVMSEFEFHRALAHEIKTNFADFNMVDQIIVIHRENGYAKLPSEINSFNPDLVVSLHANAHDTTVQGCEMLYYHKSEKGKGIAQIFQDKLQALFLNRDRGIKPKTSEDRGGHLLKGTHAPCIICEPFFIDNNDDYLNAERLYESGKLTKVYCEAINDAVKYLRDAS
jgi:N-acetylmuramoyl-L-alanine amidase